MNHSSVTFVLQGWSSPSCANSMVMKASEDQKTSAIGMLRSARMRSTNPVVLVASVSPTMCTGMPVFSEKASRTGRATYSSAETYTTKGGSECSQPTSGSRIRRCTKKPGLVLATSLTLGFVLSGLGLFLTRFVRGRVHSLVLAGLGIRLNRLFYSLTIAEVVLERVVILPW